MDSSNDLRNKAAEKGANVVVAQPHQVGQTTGQYGIIVHRFLILSMS